MIEESLKKKHNNWPTLTQSEHLFLHYDLIISQLIIQTYILIYFRQANISNIKIALLI